MINVSLRIQGLTALNFIVGVISSFTGVSSFQIFKD